MRDEDRRGPRDRAFRGRNGVAVEGPANMRRARTNGGSGSTLSPRPEALLVGLGRSGRSLAAALAARGLGVLHIEEFPHALETVAAGWCDSVVTGPETGDGEVIRFLRELRDLDASVDVIYLADRPSTGEARRALEAGADDVVCPPHSAGSLLVRHSVLERRRRAPASLRLGERRVAVGPLTLDLRTRQVMDGEELLTLSGREFELLLRLMEADGDVVSREALVEDIWGDGQDSEGVLDATVHRLRRKLEESGNPPGMVATVRGVGYRLLASPPVGSPNGAATVPGGPTPASWPAVQG